MGMDNRELCGVSQSVRDGRSIGWSVGLVGVDDGDVNVCTMCIHMLPCACACVCGKIRTMTMVAVNRN